MVVDYFNTMYLIAINDPQASIYMGEVSSSNLPHNQSNGCINKLVVVHLMHCRLLLS